MKIETFWKIKDLNELTEVKRVSNKYKIKTDLYDIEIKKILGQIEYKQIVKAYAFLDKLESNLLRGIEDSYNTFFRKLTFNEIHDERVRREAEAMNNIK